MMKKRIYIFLILATLYIVSWVFAAAQPFSPLDHSALQQQQQGTRRVLQAPQVAFHSIQGNERRVKSEEEEERRYALGMSRLGSRPPICEHRCGHCRPCIAIQVPTNTHNFKPQFANYEPEGWKCKCGSTFFNP